MMNWKLKSMTHSMDMRIVLVITLFGLNQIAFAEEKCCWIDAKTGKQVNTIPGGSLYEDGGRLNSGYGGWSDPNHAHNPKTGQNFVRQPDGCWIDAKIGKQINTIPGGSLYEDGGRLNSGYGGWSDPNHAYNPKTGQNFVRVPCPPPVTANPPPETPPSNASTPNSPPTRTATYSGLGINPPPEPPKVSSVSPGWTGAYLGGELAKNSGWVRSTETLGATGAQTNQFTDTGDPVGGGVVLGYNFKPWNELVVIGPFVSADGLRQTINHNFAGGTFLGTTTNWFVTAGARVGIVAMPRLLIYGIGGVSWLNEDMNINFGGPITSQNTTVPGFTLGPGVEYQPSVLQQFGLPVSLFMQYQHTWWQDAKLNNPAASPNFNYIFQRNDDTFKFGVKVYFP